MNLSYNYFLYSSIFNAIVITILGAVVYFKNPKGKLNRIFALFCLAIGEWAYTYIGWPLSKTANDTLFWFQLLHIGACFVSILYLHLVINWLSLYNKFNNYIIKVGYLISTFFALNTFSPYFIAEMRPIFSMRFWAVPGILYHFYLVSFFSLFLYATYLLYINVKKNTGIKRKQIQFVLFGMVLTFLGGSTNYFLWYGINIPPYGNLLAASFVIFTAYAIIRYRFMDIRLIIKRSAVFATLVIIITVIYSILAYLISIFFTGLIGVQSVVLNGVLTAVFVAVGFEPLKKFLSITTDKFLFKAEYNPEEVLSEFSDKLASTLELEGLSHYLVDRLEQVFKTTFVSLFLLDENRKVYAREAVAGKPKQDLARIEQKLFSKIFNYLKGLNRERDLQIRDEIRQYNEQLKNPVLDLLLKQLETYEVNIISPLYQRDKLVGILFLGDRKSGDVFSTEDLKVLEIISAQAAVAMQNSKLFEEQKKFAIHLKKEVDKATKELRSANIQLRKLDQAKSEFISIASHQLRTPLTVIKGYLSMVEQGDFGKVPQKVSLPLDRVYKSTLRIITLVEDLLNVSRLESGRMKYDFAKVDLSQIISDVYDELKQSAINKGLHFEYQKPKEKIPLIILDKMKVREVIMNLMDNAIKYSDAGNVIVKLERLDNHVEFSVNDNGRGIAKNEMPLLFQKFSRAKGVQLVHTEGTGLGLYIAKQIIEKHGGEIGARSKGLRKGSTFYIKFKIENKRLEKELGKAK